MVTEARSFDLGRQPYLDVEDTIAEVEISRRQLGHWEEQGLLQPELGDGARKYTVNDIRRLKALKHLIVDQKMPIALVKDLVQGGVWHGVEVAMALIETSALFERKPHQLISQVYDFDRRDTVSGKEYAVSWWSDYIATANEETIEGEVYELALLLFRAVKQRFHTPAAFMERREDILNTFARIADLARLEAYTTGEGPADVQSYLSPTLPGEQPYAHVPVDQEMYRWAISLNKYRNALDKHMQRNPNLRSLRDRFWLDRSLDAMEKMADVPF